MQKLKEATRSQHEGLESAVDVMSESLAIDDYTKLLTKFYRFYLPVERELAKLDLESAGYRLSERRKVPRLEEDLEFLGVLETAQKTVEPFSGVPRPGDIAEAFGVLYVLEGATLGGRIIDRHLREHLGVEPGKGGSFFNGYGTRTGEMWKEFGQTVQEYADKHGGEDRMIDLAKQTFDGFRLCFAEPVGV